MVYIKELLSYNSTDIQELDALMRELSSTSFCNEKILRDLLSDKNSHLYVMTDNSLIIACGCLCVAHTPEFTKGFVESVAVKSEYRGKHLGRKMMEHIIGEAKRLGVQHLTLTSRPSRIAANELYKSLGFIQYETNCYQMVF